MAATARRSTRYAAPLLLASVLAAATFVPDTPLARSLSITGLAPVEVVAAGFRDPVGIAADEAGALYVSDADAGTITRIDPDGRLRVVARGLQQPVGLAFDPAGRLLIAEEGRGRVLIRESAGTLSVLASGIKKPQWLAVADDGTVYVAAKALREDHRRHEHDARDDHEDSAGNIIVRLAPGSPPSVLVDGFKGLQGIALHGDSLYAAAERLRGDPEHAGSTVVRIPIGANGQPGAAQRLVTVHARHPVGLIVDRLGAVFFTVERLHDSDAERRGLILKWLPDGRLETFAAGLRKPRGLALEADGHLLAVDDAGGDAHDARLFRFRAPALPAVTAPAFVNRSPITLPGTAEPRSLVAAYHAGELTTPLATATAQTSSGSFTLPITLVPNAENRLAIVATGAGGLGLTSAPVDASIVHDDVPPSLRILQPLGGAFVRQLATLVARASDGGSGVASVVFTLDGRPIGTLLNPHPLQVFTASLPFDSAQVADGVHTLAVTAHDRAGNVGSTSQSIIVDSTPPETEITAGPSGEVGDTEVTFTVTGLDALTPTPSLQFASRLDGGLWSAFASATTITLRGLAEGPRVFEVKARDLAGNEDATPARRAFTVSLLGVTITEPSEGATVPEGPLLVRGTVRAGGVEVGVTVNDVPAAVQGTTFAALVPVTPATTALTARATTARGQTTSHQVAIAVTAAPAPPVVLYASPASGVAPLTVSFAVVGTPVISVELDRDGDGVADFSGPTLDGQEFTYDRPGLYVARVTAIDARGNRLVASAAIEVLDQTALDQTLTAKWIVMKDALRAGDVPKALELIAVSARDDYRDMLTGLGSQLAQIDLILTDISAVSFDPNRAEYQMIRIDGGTRLSYFVLFVRDIDGLWRLKFF